MKVSIIIPVYNCKAFLQECLSGVLTQTCDDMEVLLIDDASTDGSGRLCDSYAEKYPHVQAVHVLHGGAGEARNAGLRIASGEYIVFADSDDRFFSGDSVRKLVECLETSGGDIAVGNYCRLMDGHLAETTGHSAFHSMAPDSAAFRFGGFFSVGTLAYVWGKAYRHSFLKEHGIYFGSYEYAEDKLFNFRCYIENAQYAFTDDTVYVYRKNESSVSNQARPDRAACWLQLSGDLADFLEEKHCGGEYGDLVAFTVAFAAFFDAKARYCSTGKSLRAVKALLQTYIDSPLAYRCLCRLARGEYLENFCSMGWKTMLWGFSALMKIKALYLLALGIKLLIDLRIDAQLSSTGQKKRIG